MKVLVDADLVLVAYLNQGKWLKEVEILWNMMESGQIQGHITEYGLDKVRFVVSKVKNPELGEEVFFDVHEIIQVLQIKCGLFEKANKLNFLDYESALEVVCAIAENLGAVVTLTPENYPDSTLPVLSVSSLLERQRLESLTFLAEQEIETMSAEITVAKILPAEISQKPVELTKWFEYNIVEASQSDWQPLEENLPFRNRPCGVVRAKTFQFNSKLSTALVVHVIPQYPEIVIVLEVRAVESSKSNFITNNVKILPEDLLLIVLDESGDESMRMKARQKDFIMRLEFKADRGDRFMVKLILANQVFVENFIL